MIPFIAKTWFLWWLLAEVLILSWLHALFARNRMEATDPLTSEEEAAYIASWRLFRKDHAISFSRLGMDR